MKLSISNTLALALANATTSVYGAYANTFQSNKKAVALDLVRQERQAKMFGLPLEKIQKMEKERNTQQTEKLAAYLSPDYKFKPSKIISVSRTDVSIDFTFNEDFLKDVIKNQVEVISELAVPLVDIWCIITDNDNKVKALRADWSTTEGTETATETTDSSTVDESPTKTKNTTVMGGWKLEVKDLSNGRILNEDGEGYLTIHNFSCTRVGSNEDAIVLYEHNVKTILQLASEKELLELSTDKDLPKSLINTIREQYNYPVLTTVAAE